MGAPIGLNEQIRRHAEDSKDWRHNDKAVLAYAVADRLNEKLFGGSLPAPVLGFDDSGRLKKAGAYHFEGDGVSLSHHIDLRKDLSELDLVVALIHNMTHLELETYQTPATWYHSMVWRKRMAGFGLTATKAGDLASIDVAAFGKVLTDISLEHMVGVLATFEVVEAPAATDDGIPPAEPVTEGAPEPEVSVTKAGKSQAAKVGIVEPQVSFLPVDGQPQPAKPALTMGSWVKALHHAGMGATLAAGPASVKPPALKPAAKKKGLRKWTCGCTNIWASVKVDATCNRCEKHFEEVVK